MRALAAFTLCMGTFGSYAVAADAGREKPDTMAKPAPAQGSETRKSDAVERLIEQGTQSYREGEAQAAIDALRRAIEEIQKSCEKSLASFLPNLPPGWNADAPKSASGTWGSAEGKFQWSTVSREYRNLTDGTKVNVQLTNAPQLVQAQRQLLEMRKNPQFKKMVEMDPGRDITDLVISGWSGWRNVEKGGESQIMLLSRGLLLTIDVASGSETLVDQFLASIDLKGMLTSGHR